MAGSLNIGTPNTLSTTYSTTGYYVDGVRVLTSRQGAIANSTDDPNIAVNNILVVLRNHGLIAP